MGAWNKKRYENPELERMEKLRGGLVAIAEEENSGLRAVRAFGGVFHVYLKPGMTEKKVKPSVKGRIKAAAGDYKVVYLVGGQTGGQGISMGWGWGRRQII